MKITLLTASILIVFSMLSQNGNNGSLAIDANNGNQYGWAINYSSQQEANKKAISECEKAGGNNCSTVLWFEGGCAVYVIDKNNPEIYGWGCANTQTEAENIAKNEAKARGGTNLIVRVWGCNDNELTDHDVTNPTSNGVFIFHYTKSEKEKKAYISNMMYYNNVAQKNNETWTWKPNAEKILSPKASTFYDKVTESLYYYMSAKEKEQYLTRNPNLDWEGISDIKYVKALLDFVSVEKRKVLFNKTREKLINDLEEENYTIIYFNL